MEGQVENLGLGEPEFPQGDGMVSRYHETKFRHNQYNPSFLGKYWCQVINTTADPDQPLMRSNVFTLLPPSNYTGSRCGASLQYITKRTCADLSDTALSNTTTTTTDTSTIMKPGLSFIIGQ